MNGVLVRKEDKKVDFDVSHINVITKNINSELSDYKIKILRVTMKACPNSNLKYLIGKQMY